MASSQDLHQLIHSLSKNEKGYFVKFAQSQGTRSDYMDLFKALLALPEYDREILQQRYPKAGFLKNLSANQHYLYGMILKSLRLYAEKKQYDIQLYAMLAEAAVLEGKGLNQQALALLQKTRKKALVHQHFAIVLDILKREAILLVANRKKILLKETLDLYAELIDLIELVKEEYTFRQLHHSMLLCYRRGAWTAREQFSELLRSVSDHPFMSHDYSPRSFYAKYYQLNIRCIEAQLYGDREIAHDLYLKIIAIWEAHPQILRANSNLYKIHLSNFLGNAIAIRQFNNFDNFIEKIEQQPAQNTKEKIEDFQNILYLKSLYFLNSNRLEEGAIYVQQIEKALKQQKRQMNPARVVAIQYNFLTLFFLVEAFEEAQYWLNSILEQDNREIRADALLFVRIMGLIVHFELNNDQLLDYFLTSTKWAIRKSPQKQQYEGKILHLFKQLFKSTPGAAQKDCFCEFKDFLSPLKNQSPKPISLDELLIWLTARIERRSLKSVYLEQQKNQG